jgi:hypothetical protein
MHHVLTLPRTRRREDADDATWLPVTVPATDGVAAAHAARAARRMVMRVEGVGIFSVAKLALLFFGCIFACIAGGVLLVWTAISTLGYVERFEDFMRSIGFRGFEVSSGDVVLGLIGVAGALTLLGTILTVMVACAYNAVGHVGHGLVLRMSEPIGNDDPPTPTELTEETPTAAETGVDQASVDGAPHAA